MEGYVICNEMNSKRKYREKTKRKKFEHLNGADFGSIFFVEVLPRLPCVNVCFCAIFCFVF